MVFISPLPKTEPRRPRVGGQQQQEGDHQAEQQHQQQKTSSTRGAAAAAVNVKSHTAGQDRQQPARPTLKAGTAGRVPNKSKVKSKPAEDKGPDPQQLLAYQAALATQVLQREFAALQTQHSSTNLQSLDSQQHPQQQQTQVAAAPGAASVAMHNASPTGKRPGQGWPASAPAQQGHSPAKQQPAQQRQKQQQQQRAAPATQQQGMPAKQQQARQMPMLQQQSAVVLPVQPKKSQNHMFWDVAPRTINPAQVPGLTDQPDPAASSSTPRCFASTAGDQQQPQEQQQLPQYQPVQQQQQQSYGKGPSAAGAVDAADNASDGPSSQHHLQQQAPYAQAAASPLRQQMPHTSAQDTWQHPAQHPQQQQQQHAVGMADKAAELSEALHAAERHPDPQARQRMIKEIKQQMYKLELEQQIAERDATRRASKATAVARETAEAAARAAAPPPWDPAAKMGRRGGGGEPLRSMDGTAVTDLRNQRHMLPAPGLDVSSSQCFDSTPAPPTHQQQQQQQWPQQQQQQQWQRAPDAPLPAATSAAGSPNRSRAAANSSPGAFAPSAANASAQGSFARRDSDSMAGAAATATAAAAATAAASAAAGGKSFMGSMSELRAGPSQEQRAAAAAARQQLQRDLEAQMVEKAARAQALEAAEAARTAAEEAALQQYLLNKSSSQADVAAVGKEASMVYAAAGPLNAPVVQVVPPPAAAAAAVAPASSSGGGGGPAALRKERSKRVIDAPWLDQLKQQPQHQNHLRSSMQDQQLQQQQHNNLRASMQEQQLQLEQQLSQLQLPSHHTLPQQHSQQQLHSTAHAAAAGSSQHTGQLWQETSQLQLGPGATAAHGSGDGGGAQTHRLSQPFMQQLNQSQNLGGQQLTAALQQVQHLQQEQLRMWADFKRQAQEMQQLLNDKQGVATDRNAARAELLRLQELLQQQKHLQQAYAGKQQELLELEQQQQYLPVSAAGQAGVHAQQHQQQRQHSVEGLWDGQDCLDAFVVETQLVPISVNNIPGGDVDTEAVSDVLPPLQQQHSSVEPSSRLPAGQASHGRNHKSRYSSFYGLEAELSAASVASQSRKARTRVSGSFRAGVLATAAEHPSVNSSLAASTSFVPFTSSMQHRQLQDMRDQQQQQAHGFGGTIGGYGDAANGDTGSNPGGIHKGGRRAAAGTVGAAALAAASDAAGRGTGRQGLGGSPAGKRSVQGSPDRTPGSASPGKGRKGAANRGWAR